MASVAPIGASIEALVAYGGRCDWFVSSNITSQTLRSDWERRLGHARRNLVIYESFDEIAAGLEALLLQVSPFDIRPGWDGKWDGPLPPPDVARYRAMQPK